MLDPQISENIVKAMNTLSASKSDGGDQLLVRMTAAQLKQLDAYMVLCGENITRPEALRRLMAVALNSMLGYRPNVTSRDEQAGV